MTRKELRTTIEKRKILTLPGFEQTNGVIDEKEYYGMADELFTISEKGVEEARCVKMPCRLIK